MADIFTNAVPVVGSQSRGVHLAWLGPATFIYAPGGWTIERRQSQPI